MSTLTGPAILKAIELGWIKIEPFDPNFVNPHSVDLHLGPTLKMYRNDAPRGAHYPRFSHLSDANQRHPKINGSRVYDFIDSKHPPVLEDVPLQCIPTRPEEEGWFLYPGVLYLGSTLEYTETRGYRPVLDGRSSTGRLGAFMHITAGYGDNGFRGHWTLEIMVVEPLILYPGQRLLQISYETLEGQQTFYGETENSSGTYQSQIAEPVASKSALDVRVSNWCLIKGELSRDVRLVKDLCAAVDKWGEVARSMSLCSTPIGRSISPPVMGWNLDWDVNGEPTRVWLPQSVFYLHYPRAVAFMDGPSS